jgi:hypothetical protein
LFLRLFESDRNFGTDVSPFARRYECDGSKTRGVVEYAGLNSAHKLVLLRFAPWTLTLAQVLREPPGPSLPFADLPAAKPGPSGSGFAYVLLVGKFSALRSLGENPIIPSSRINNETSPDLIWSNRYRASNVAAISTKNLSALVNQNPRDCISSHAALTGSGRLGGGSGSGVVTSGSFFRALRRSGFLLKAPRNSSTAVGVRVLPIGCP